MKAFFLINTCVDVFSLYYFVTKIVFKLPMHFNLNKIVKLYKLYIYERGFWYILNIFVIYCKIMRLKVALCTRFEIILNFWSDF
jgi:hypothetical protein